MTELESLRDALREFTAARDRDQFHSPKNLAMAVSVEAGELLEVFQWLTESRAAPRARGTGGGDEEIADVLLYLVRLGDQLGIDPVAAARQAGRERAEVSGGQGARYQQEVHRALGWRTPTRPHWNEDGEPYAARWRSERGAPPPKRADRR